MDEGQTVALEALHDEALSAKKTGPQAFLKRDADTHAFRGAEERVFLCDEFAAEFAEIDGLDFPGVRRAESDAFFPRALIHKDSHEERFAGEQAFAGAEERTHEPFVRI